MPKYERDVARLVNREFGVEILPGSKIEIDGEVTTFRYVSRLPEPGKSGKIFTDIRPGGEFYPSVVGADIEIV